MRSGETKPVSSTEQRDHLANERTLLAWVRTGVTIMAFGFVVAKFGLVLDELPGHHHNLGSHFADIVGTLLVASGAVFLVLSTIEFLSVGRAIKSGNLRARPLLFMALSGLLVIVAVVLAIYLLLTS